MRALDPAAPPRARAARAFRAAGCAAISVACGAPLECPRGPLDPGDPATSTAGAGQDPTTRVVTPGTPALSVTPGTGCADAPGTGPADPDGVEVIRPGRKVPAFEVTTLDCQKFSSSDFVGRRAFALVFFSSWCHVCEKKMPMIRRAIADLSPALAFVGVSLDDDETWSEVKPFLDRHRVSLPIVRGARFRSFAQGYDPFGSIPVIVVVGLSGEVVDVQVGYTAFDYNRLVAASVLAREAAPPTGDPAPAPPEELRSDAEPLRSPL